MNGPVTMWAFAGTSLVGVWYLWGHQYLKALRNGMLGWRTRTDGCTDRSLAVVSNIPVVLLSLCRSLSLLLRGTLQCLVSMVRKRSVSQHLQTQAAVLSQGCRAWEPDIAVRAVCWSPYFAYQLPLFFRPADNQSRTILSDAIPNPPSPFIGCQTCTCSSLPSPNKWWFPNRLANAYIHKGIECLCRSGSDPWLLAHALRSRLVLGFPRSF